MIYDSGKRCVSLIDRIIESWDLETIDPAGKEFELTSGAVRNIFDVAARGREPAVTGNVLVVDDNETNCEILRRRLEREDHRVSVASNGAQALEMISRENFDLVLLDIVMPEMDGFEVLLRMKRDERLREIPVIMISALDEVDVAVRCIEAGAEDYLSKPFNPVLLHARIGACLEKKQFHEREVEHLRQIEQQKRRADELLHVILPAEIVAELKSTNSVVPRRYENVAVLFADLVDFTSYCDRNPAEEVVARLQKLVIEWENAAVRRRVEKIKTIGDAFMAAGGLLKPCENPVLNCVRCGLDMIEATARLTTDWTLRIGIHCGPVVAGVLGRRQYLFDLWGDTVNTAARVESHGIPGAITLSPQAWQQIQPFSAGTSLGAVSVKGKGVLELMRFDQFHETFAQRKTEAV
ncbi:MAG: response regulator [Planctomycetes bacterium]|nr:response regulator [Planctomycetota bacterium]